ncbi:tail protein X [Roseibium sp.]|uniref:tail protein X n=1 Tax=Roseibium sp. TaxID=1936156 RepID=UPI003B51ED28
MPEEVTITGDNVTADLLLWRKYGITGQKLVREFFELNRGLSAFGVYLPLGRAVLIPDMPAPEPYEEVQVVTLFNPRP